MTKAQNTLYFREWAAAKAALVARGISAKDAEAMRHGLHVEALGVDRSHTAFSNRDFDRVLGAFRGLSKPDDLPGQMRLAEMERTRCRHRVARLLEQLGAGEPYRDAIIARMAGEGGLSSVRYGDLRVEGPFGNELQKLIVALDAQRRRRAFTARSKAAREDLVLADSADPAFPF